MKIALIFFNLTVQAGGQQQFLSLAQELRRRGDTVTIYTTEADRRIFPKLWEGLDVAVVAVEPSLSSSSVVPSLKDSLWKRLAKKWRMERQYREAAWQIAQKMDVDFDAVNCHEDFAYKVGFDYKQRIITPLGIPPEHPHARIVWTMNHPPFMHLKKKGILDLLGRIFNAWKDLSERRCFRAVDAVAVLSSYEKSWCEKKGLPVKIVWSGLDFRKFYAPVHKSHAPLRILAVGALNPYRRYEDLIEAVRTTPNVSARIIAKSDDPIAKETLTRLAAGLSVHFDFQGASDEELLEAYRESDVLVLLSHIPLPFGYGWGVTAFEAMAAGLAVVVNNATGAAHILTDGENALFVRPMDPEDLAFQLKRLADPALYGTIATGGQEFTKDNISWERYAENMLRLYRGTDVQQP